MTPVSREGHFGPIWGPLLRPLFQGFGPFGPKPVISSINIWGSGQPLAKRAQKRGPKSAKKWSKMTLFWPFLTTFGVHFGPLFGPLFEPFVRLSV